MRNAILVMHIKGKWATVNVDIFACINFRRFMKMCNLECIKISVLSMTGY